MTAEILEPAVTLRDVKEQRCFKRRNEKTENFTTLLAYRVVAAVLKYDKITKI